MKKLILFSVILWSISSYAQNVQLGVKGGVNISNFTGGDFSTVKNKALVGFHAGGFLRFKFSNFALQPEVLFSSQGAKLENSGTNNTYRVSYVNVPVLLQLETNSGFYVEAGPQIGFKVNENIPNTTIGTFAKSTDLSVALGLGFHGHSGFGIGGRYNIGLSKVGNFNSNTLNNLDPNFKNGVIMISLFYTLFNNK